MVIHVTARPRESPDASPGLSRAGVDGSRVATWLGRGIALLLLALPVTFVVVGVRQLLRYHAAGEYALVEGRVVSSTIERTPSEVSRSTTRPSYTYRPLVTYEYRVGGRMMRSSRVTFLGESGSEDWAAAIAAAYAPGTSVLVHHDPSRPDNAYLDAGGTPAIPWVLVGMGGITLLAWGRAAVRARRRAPP